MNFNKYNFSFPCPSNATAKKFDAKYENKTKVFPSKKDFKSKPNNAKQCVEAKCTWVNEISFDNIRHDSLLSTFTFESKGKLLGL